MKFLFDFFPILLFFGVFKLGERNKEGAHSIASEYLSGFISGGAITPEQAPIMLATVVVIFATLAQIAWVKLRGRKVDGMLWLSFGIITIFGGATIYFHDENFIKWKPTILYWVLAFALFVAQFGFRKNLMRQAMEQTIKLPDTVWTKVSLSWMAFFFVIGLINLLAAFVVFKADTSAWVSFKLFGLTGIFFAFVVAQTLYLSKYIEEEKA
ncbi:septation protein A [Massilia cavernae]|uniref:Inner membrane-spanning protein YciB n=1 Tax=Massilia cavernae TaxID=2320864 RepID=A0A418Y4X9_9BURK|nr:septation protein A [Massilia cavernae]RJG21173.1 septation protein A [Massilia cavernae]